MQLTWVLYVNTNISMVEHPSKGRGLLQLCLYGFESPPLLEVVAKSVMQAWKYVCDWKTLQNNVLNYFPLNADLTGPSLRLNQSMYLQLNIWHKLVLTIALEKSNYH